MRNITKRTEPASLTQHRLTTHSGYDNYQDKVALRNALVGEQRGLCCYCLQPIQASDQKMKIEHWHSQKRYHDEQLTYSNLLGACKGNEGQPKVDQHCDTFKGETDLSRNPANVAQNVEALVHYLSDGRVISPNEEFDAELNNVLNLNVAYLINSRKFVLKSFLKSVTMPHKRNRQFWIKALEDWSGHSDVNSLSPFCTVIVFWIRKTKLDSSAT
jgi:uncharacterized protein (TIGR02646 family)